MTSAGIHAHRAIARNRPVPAPSISMTPTAARSASSGTNSNWYLEHAPKKKDSVARELNATHAAEAAKRRILCPRCLSQTKAGTAAAAQRIGALRSAPEICSRSEEHTSEL